MAWRVLLTVYLSCLLPMSAWAHGAVATAQVTPNVLVGGQCEGIFGSVLADYVASHRLVLDRPHQSQRLEIMHFMEKVRLEWGRETDFKYNQRSVDFDMFDLNRFYRLPTGRFIVMRDQDGGIVGTGGVTKVAPRTCELRKWYVDSDKRKAPKGLGKAVLNELIRTARMIGCDVLIAKTHSDATAALATYENLGFLQFPFSPDPSKSDSTADVAFHLILNR